MLHSRTLTLLLFLLAASPVISGEIGWEPVRAPQLGRDYTASERRDSDRPYWRRNLFKRIGGDQKFLVTTWWPAEARRVGFSLPIALAIAGASQTGSNTDSFDIRSAQSIQAWSAAERRGPAEFFSALGDGSTAAVLLGGTYLISRWAGNERLQRTTSLSAEAMLNSAIYVTVLKGVARRTRPTNGGTGAFFVSNPELDQEPNSFPSGHATGAFTLAAVLAGEYRERRWVAWVSYSTAGLVALSRVQLGRHFPSDVIAGAILGQSMGSMVIHRAGDVDRRSSPIWQQLQPYVDPDSGGLGLVYRHSW